jgi:hypothetical protein
MPPDESIGRNPFRPEEKSVDIVYRVLPSIGNGDRLHNLEDTVEHFENGKCCLHISPFRDFKLSMICSVFGSSETATYERVRPREEYRRGRI